MKSLSVILTLLTFILAFAHAANEPEDSLILYMSFDTVNGKNTIDHSKYENHGELKGAPKLVDGKFGKALELNGTSDWVEVPHHETLTVGKDVTVMAWIHTERHEGPNNQRWQGIIAKSNNPRSYSLYTEIPSKCMAFSVNSGTSVCTGEVKLNTWQHVVAQVDGTTHRYWLNGKKAGEFGGKKPPPGKADTQNVMIGRTHEGRREFLGMMDEVRIWNRALSEEEVIEQMGKGYFEFFAVDPKLKLTTTWGNLKVKQR